MKETTAGKLKGNITLGPAGSRGVLFTPSFGKAFFLPEDSDHLEKSAGVYIHV